MGRRGRLKLEERINMIPSEDDSWNHGGDRESVVRRVVMRATLRTPFSFQQSPRGVLPMLLTAKELGKSKTPSG